MGWRCRKRMKSLGNRKTPLEAPLGKLQALEVILLLVTYLVAGEKVRHPPFVVVLLRGVESMSTWRDTLSNSMFISVAINMVRNRALRRLKPSNMCCVNLV